MITYNNKDILKSFIGNNRIVKKYLNNKVVYGTPDFAQYYLIDHKDNYDIVGDTIIQNNIANNFSVGEEGNHLKINNFSTTWSFSTLELNAKFRFTNISEYNNSYLLGTSHSTPFNRFGLSAQNYSQEQVSITPMVYLVNPDNGNYFSISGPQFPLIYKNTWYILNLITNGTDMELSLLSEDGILLRKQSTPFGTPTNKCYSFDIIGNTNIDINGVDWAGYFHGDIDLSETYIKVNDRYMFNGNQNYKELLWCNPNVYLQSSGTQYIDSGIYANSNLSNELVINFNGNNGQRLFGARKAYLQDAFALFYSNMLASTYGTSDFGYTIPFTKNIKNTIYRNKNKVFLNGELVQTDTEQSFTTNYPLYLFTVNQNGSVLTPNASYTKIYLSKIWNNEELVQYLVPVPQGLQIGNYKVPSNGMFDIVTQTFFANQGTGDFIWGVDL